MLKNISLGNKWGERDVLCTHEYMYWEVYFHLSHDIEKEILERNGNLLSLMENFKQAK